MSEQEINNLEKKEIDALIERGLKWNCKKNSLLRFIGSETREFIIKPFSLGLILMLSAEFKKINFNPHKIDDNWMSESKNLMATAPEPLSRIIMIAVLRNKVLIKYFGGFVANYFLNRVEPKQLLELAMIINQMCNPTDFILSIKFLSIHQMIIKPPHLIEKIATEEEEVILD